MFYAYNVITVTKMRTLQYPPRRERRKWPRGARKVTPGKRGMVKCLLPDSSLMDFDLLFYTLHISQLCSTLYIIILNAVCIIMLCVYYNALYYNAVHIYFNVYYIYYSIITLTNSSLNCFC